MTAFTNILTWSRRAAEARRRARWAAHDGKFAARQAAIAAAVREGKSLHEFYTSPGMGDLAEDRPVASDQGAAEGSNTRPSAAVMKAILRSLGKLLQVAGILWVFLVFTFCLSNVLDHYTWPLARLVGISEHDWGLVTMVVTAIVLVIVMVVLTWLGRFLDGLIAPLQESAADWLEQRRGKGNGRLASKREASVEVTDAA